MYREYLTEKENPYWFGVLQGNYAEEINAKDPLLFLDKSSSNMQSEFRERFKDPRECKNYNELNSKQTKVVLNDKEMLKAISKKSDHISMQEDKLLKLNTNYQSVYHLSYDNQIKPQEITKNNLKGEQTVLQGIQQTEKQAEKLKYNFTPEKLKNLQHQNHFRKDMGFVTSFNKEQVKLNLRK